MFVLTRSFTFSACHHLRSLPEGHQSRRQHGHLFEVTFEMTRPDDHPAGPTRDLADLQIVSAYLAAQVDHRCLNDVWPKMEPSAANIARHLFLEFCDLLDDLTGVGCAPQPDRAVWYRPQQP